MKRGSKWLIQKKKALRTEKSSTIWLFGLHAVREALINPKRELLRLIVTKNAWNKLTNAIAYCGISPELSDARRFAAPLDSSSIHQGAALETKALDWGDVKKQCGSASRVILLDRITDPHNVGAILRSAEVFGAQAVIGTRHHSAAESGALAKAASGALERQPYFRVSNWVGIINDLQKMGFFVLGLDGESKHQIEDILNGFVASPIAIVVGSEGYGLRPSTQTACDALARIEAAHDFGSLNVSNAAAIALYAARRT